MSDSARADLARTLAEHTGGAGGQYPSDGGRHYQPSSRKRSGKGEIARVAAELQRTERRIQTTAVKAPVGRTNRLSSRASRLERKLRRLK